MGFECAGGEGRGDDEGGLAGSRGEVVMWRWWRLTGSTMGVSIKMDGVGFGWAVGVDGPREI